MARLRLGVFGCDGVVQQLLAGLVALPVILGGLNGLIVILLLFSLWHASVALGPRLTLVFFAITTVTSWIFEEIGVTTGLVYGPYHYTSTLGPWLGSVPVLIPWGSETQIRSRRGAVVFVDEPAEQVPPANITRTDRHGDPHPAEWRGEADGAMRSLPVECSA
jgi:Carotenoid biosynthesis protein